MNRPTDQQQQNVRPETLDRRIRRVRYALEVASERGEYRTYALSGYLSQRARDAGEDPRTIRITVMRAWMPGTGRFSVSGPVDDDGDIRTLNLYQARSIRRIPTPSHHVDVITAYRLARD